MSGLYMDPSRLASGPFSDIRRANQLPASLVAQSLSGIEWILMISFRYQIMRANSRIRTGKPARLTAILIACMCLLPGHAYAGGGPEKVLVVVNGD